jgi:dTDP-4-dehydrorhamnose reductase
MTPSPADPPAAALKLPRRDALRGTRVLLTGAGGQLGGNLRARLHEAGAIVSGLGAHPGNGVDLVVDIRDEAATRQAIIVVAPEIVIHGAAYTDVDGAERDPACAAAVNVGGSHHVATAAHTVGAYLIGVSTDFVFAGDGGAPYAEDARPHPISVYGRTKWEGEQAILDANPSFAIARTAWVYGGPGKHFPRTVLTVLRDRGSIDVVDDERGSPTFAGDLAAALVALATTRGAGIYHLVNAGSSTRHELAQAVARAAGFEPSLVRATTTATFLARYPLPARRPADSRLANTRAAALGIQLRSWQDAVQEYVPRLAAELGIDPR